MRDKPTPGSPVWLHGRRGCVGTKDGGGARAWDPAGCIGYNKFPLSRVCQLIGRLYHLIKATRPAHLLSVSRQLGVARARARLITPVENQEKFLAPEFTRGRGRYIPEENTRKIVWILSRECFSLSNLVTVNSKLSKLFNKELARNSNTTYNSSVT